ncbi:hypothetical protein [Homoserinibacter sp. GY 40078]|uniref:hypothetical protein n=1 Tax=Homoserinibacter sp. GY 40078 TaxID=2603275 RepID=UPI0011CAC7A3|nr:hypothetical protein [Homoserinibacter sp. GY 40078]TXK19068.1 hypothetical protein FVQ89_03860 [Homoserinibacter sp. GY 40078]
MNDSTTPPADGTPAAEEAAPAAVSSPAGTASAPVAADAEPADATVKQPRTWRTRAIALTGIAALVLGLGAGGVSGWAIANAQRPSFGQMGGFPGGDGDFQPPDGQMPGGDGDMPQRPDGGDSSGDTSSGSTDSSSSSSS